MTVMGYPQRGFTLIEMLMVVALISVTAVAGVGVVLDYRKQVALSAAVTQAREIACLLEQWRRSDVGINTDLNDSISLRQFRTMLMETDAHLVSRHFPMLDIEDDTLGTPTLDFYQIRTTDYSVLVSFRLPADQYGDIQLAHAAGVIDPHAGIVSWTVMQQVGTGITNAYMAMNGIYAR